MVTEPIPTISIVAVNLTDVAQKALANIKKGPNSRALATLTKVTQALPRAIDAAVLPAGKAAAGRGLLESEKRTLRGAFKALL